MTDPEKPYDRSMLEDYTERIEDENLREEFRTTTESVKPDADGSFGPIELGEAFRGQDVPRLKSLAMEFMQNARSSMDEVLD